MRQWPNGFTFRRLLAQLLMWLASLAVVLIVWVGSGVWWIIFISIPSNFMILLTIGLLIVLRREEGFNKMGRRA